MGIIKEIAIILTGIASGYIVGEILRRVAYNTSKSRVRWWIFLAVLVGIIVMLWRVEVIELVKELVKRLTE